MPATVATLAVGLVIDMAGAFKELDTGLGKLANKATKGGKLIAAGLAVGTAAVGAFVKKSVDMATTFESQMAIMSTAVEPMGPSMEELHEAMLKVGADNELIGITASEAAEATTNFYRAGLVTNDIFGDYNGYMEEGASLTGALRASIDLAAASDLELAAASELVGVSMATYGIEAENATDITNALVKAANSSQAEVSDLQVALSYAGPAAADARMDIEDTAIALAMLSEGGIKGSRAGTALNRVLTDLTKGTPKATAALDELGIEIYDTDTGIMRPFDEILVDLAKSFEGMTDAEQDSYQQAIFTSQGRRGLNVLLGQGVDAWDKMAGKVEAASSVEEVAAARTNTYAGSMEKLQGTIETLMISAGDPFKDEVLRPIIDLFNELLTTAMPGIISAFEWLADVVATGVGAIRVFIVGLQTGEGIVGSFGNVLSYLLPEALVDRIMGFVESVEKFIGKVIEIVGRFVEWKDVLIGTGVVLAAIFIPILLSILSPFLALGAAIVAAIAIVAALRNAWEKDLGGMQTKITEFWEEKAKPALEALWEWLKVKVPQAIEALRAFWEEKLLPALGNIWGFWTEKVLPALEALWGWLKEKIPAAIGVLVTFWEETLLPALEQIWTAWEEKIRPAVAGVIAAFAELVGALLGYWGEISSILGDIIGAFTSAFSDSGKESLTLSERIENAVGFIVRVLNGLAIFLKLLAVIVKKVTTAIAKLWKKHGKTITKIIGIIGKILKFFLKILKRDWKGVWKDVKEFVAKTLAAIWKKIKDTFDDIWKKIRDTLDDIWEKVKEIWDDVWKWIRDRLDDIWKKVKDIWEAVWKKIRDTLDEIWAKVKNIFDDVWKKIRDTLDEIWAKVKNIFDDVWKKIRDTLDEIWAKVKNIFDDVWTKIRDTLDDILEKVKTIFDDIWTKIETILNDIVTEVETWAGELYTAFKDALTGLLDAIDEVADDLIAIGVQIIEYIVEGIQSVTDFASRMAAELQAWISEIATNAGNVAWNIIVAGATLGATVISWIIAGIQAVTTFVKKLVAQLKDWIGDIVINAGNVASDALDKAKELGGKVIQWIIDGIKGFTTFASQVKAIIVQWLLEILGLSSSAEALGADIASGLLAGFLGERGSFVSGMQNALNSWMAGMGGMSLAVGAVGAGAGAAGTTYAPNFATTINTELEEEEFYYRVEQALRNMS